MAVLSISLLRSVTSFCAESSIIRHSCRRPTRWPLGCRGHCEFSAFGRGCKQSNGRLRIVVWRVSATWRGYLGGCPWNNSLRRGSRPFSVLWRGRLERSFELAGEGRPFTPSIGSRPTLDHRRL